MRSAYVAASSAEMDRARAAMDALRSAGVRVTSTWIEGIEAAGTANEGLGPIDRRRAAARCLTEVRAADVLLILVPPGPSGIGCGVEFGYALALNKRVIAAGRTERTIFGALCGAECASDAEAIAAIVGGA